MNAPEAAVTLSGNSGVIGAITGNTITFKDHNYLHYDEELGQLGPGYVVMSWR